MQKKNYDCDVLVVGGGPAGSTVSTLLAEKGWKVVVLEKEQFPRFHIGESLLPLNLVIFKQLGVTEEIEKIGIYKYGAEFNSEEHDKPVTYYFSGAIDKSLPHAYEVKRSEFDQILLNNSKAKGVVVKEGTKVTGVEFSAYQDIQVFSQQENGEEGCWKTRFLIDASGRDVFLAKKFATQRRHPQHSSAALFAHFEGVERRTGKDEGNISVYWFEHGWYWVIPLKDGLVSVGVVCWPYYLKSRDKPAEDFLWDTIKLCSALNKRMENAKLVSDVTATGNYSYITDSLLGSDYIVLGDAYAFVDPVFSSGVLLAMNSAVCGSKVVDIALEQPDNKSLIRQQSRVFERTIKRGIKVFSWFIYRMTQPAMRNMFMAPRNIFGVKEGVLSLLSGDLFRQTPLRKPLFFFKAIYYIKFVFDWRINIAAHRKRKQKLNAQK